MTEERALVTTGGGTLVHVVELIPDQEHLVLFAASTDELPDRDVVDELRMHAYERAGGDDLGLPDVASDALNLAQLVGEGVLANVAWEGLLATKRFVERRRSRSTGSAVSPASAEERAQAAAATAGAASADATVVSTVAEQNGWTVTLGLPDGSQVRVSLDPTATVASVEHDNTP